MFYNHFENIGVLSTKTGLIKTLRDYYLLQKEAKECNYTIDDTLPLAYIITPQLTEPDFLHFKKKFQNIERHNIVH